MTTGRKVAPRVIVAATIALIAAYVAAPAVGQSGIVTGIDDILNNHEQRITVLEGDTPTTTTTTETPSNGGDGFIVSLEPLQAIDYPTAALDACTGSWVPSVGDAIRVQIDVNLNPSPVGAGSEHWTTEYNLKALNAGGNFVPVFDIRWLHQNQGPDQGNDPNPLRFEVTKANHYGGLAAGTYEASFELIGDVSGTVLTAACTFDVTS